MVKMLFFSLIILGLIIVSFYLGASKNEIKTLKNQVKTMEKIENDKKTIHSMPNASRDELLKLMYENKL